MMAQTGAKQNSDEVEILPWNDYEYNADFEEEYYNILLLESPIHVRGTISDNVWVLNNEILGTYTYLNFDNVIEIAASKNLPPTLITVIKCWVISLIEQNRVSTHIQAGLRRLTTFLEWSNGLDTTYLDDFVSIIKIEFKGRGKSRSSFCASVLNFFDFYPEAIVPAYITKIKSIKKSSSKQRVNRILPSFNDLRIFHSVLDDYIQSIDAGSSDYLRYFPLYLWWNLSCVIPMRPSEFCHIQRDALIEKKDYKNQEDKWYLKLPRKKQKNNKARVQVIDEIFIPEQWAFKIKEYIDISKNYGMTDSLISYTAYSSHPFHHHVSEKKINKKLFSASNLSVLLESFYYHIVQNKYGYSVSDFSVKWYQKKVLDNGMNAKKVKRRLRLGDTRHFAIMNLLRQGYHSVEIARLAGHTSLHAQNPYQDHEDLYYDFELIKIADYLKSELATGKSNTSSQKISNLFLTDKVETTPREGFKDNLDVGYCVDELKRCPSSFSELHIYCPYWKIDIDEFLEKKDLIAEELKQSRNKTKGFLRALLNLHSIALKEYYTSYDYKEDNAFHRAEIKKLNRNITNEIRKQEILIKNLSDSGVVNDE